MADVNIVDVIVGIPEQHIQSKMPKWKHQCVSASDMRSLSKTVRRLSSEMENISRASGKHNYFRYGPQAIRRLRGWNQDPVGMSGTRLEADFHIITRTIYCINKHHRCVRRAKLVSSSWSWAIGKFAFGPKVNDEEGSGRLPGSIGGGNNSIADFLWKISFRHTACDPLGGKTSLPKTSRSACHGDADAGRITSRLALAKSHSLRRQTQMKSYLFGAWEIGTSKGDFHPISFLL